MFNFPVPVLLPPNLRLIVIPILKAVMTMKYMKSASYCSVHQRQCSISIGKYKSSEDEHLHFSQLNSALFKTITCPNCLKRVLWDKSWPRRKEISYWHHLAAKVWALNGIANSNVGFSLWSLGLPWLFFTVPLGDKVRLSVDTWGLESDRSALIDDLVHKYLVPLTEGELYTLCKWTEMWPSIHAVWEEITCVTSGKKLKRQHCVHHILLFFHHCDPHTPGWGNSRMRKTIYTVNIRLWNVELLMLFFFLQLILTHAN